MVIPVSNKDELDSFDFFKKTKEVKKKVEKEKVKCSWCDGEFVSLGRHLPNCKPYQDYLKEKEEEDAKKTIDVQKQIEKLENDNLELRELIENATKIMKTKENPVITAILNEFATFDFDNLVEYIMVEYDLKKFDKVITGRTGSNTFWYFMDLVKKEDEITGNKEKFDISRFLNRVARGDSKMYKVFYSVIKNMILDVIKQYT